MHNYITTYDNSIRKEYAQELISKFENHQECHSLENISDDEWHMQFTQINFYEHEIFKEDRDKLDAIFREAVNHFRMKRYLPNAKDRFDLHVDVTDYNSARRFLVVFLYLNDAFEGGETVFPQLGILAKPKTGRLIMFPPPIWAWQHKANPIVSGKPKYIVDTLLHYI